MHTTATYNHQLAITAGNNGRVPCACTSHVNNKICSTNATSAGRVTDILEKL